MKKLKTLVVAILCFVFIFALCACQDPNAGGNGGNTGNNGNTGNAGSNVEMTTEQKIAHIDELVSQQVSEEVWNKAMQINAKSFTMKMVAKEGSKKTFDALMQVEVVDGGENILMDGLVNGQTIKTYKMYEDNSYYYYEYHFGIDSWFRYKQGTTSYDFGIDMAKTFIQCKYSDFTYDKNQNCYVGTMQDMPALRKIENGTLVYIKIKVPNNEQIAYLFDQGTTKVELPEEAKTLK